MSDSESFYGSPKSVEDNQMAQASCMLTEIGKTYVKMIQGFKVTDIVEQAWGPPVEPVNVSLELVGSNFVKSTKNKQRKT